MKLYLRKYFTHQVVCAVVSIRKDVLMELLWLRRKEADDLKLLTYLKYEVNGSTAWISCPPICPV